MNPPRAAVPAGQPLRPVPLPELRLLAEGRHWPVDQPIDGLESLTPVRGELRAIHHGTVLEVEGRVATIVTLRCDRCLGHFNHPLDASAHELLELRQEAPARPGMGPIPLLPEAEDLDDRLDPQGRFDPQRWLFEQLSLQLPLVNRCGADCPGPARWGSEAPAVDPRWAALQAALPKG